MSPGPKTQNPPGSHMGAGRLNRGTAFRGAPAFVLPSAGAPQRAPCPRGSRFLITTQNAATKQSMAVVQVMG